MLDHPYNLKLIESLDASNFLGILVLFRVGICCEMKVGDGIELVDGALKIWMKRFDWCGLARRFWLWALANCAAQMFHHLSLSLVKLQTSFPFLFFCSRSALNSTSP
jgi:hypothetical protein